MDLTCKVHLFLSAVGHIIWLYTTLLFYRLIKKTTNIYTLYTLYVQVAAQTYKIQQICLHTTFAICRLILYQKVFFFNIWREQIIWGG